MRRASIIVILSSLVISVCTAHALEWSKIIDDGDEGYSETSPYGSWQSWHFPGAINGDWRYLSGLYESSHGPVPRKGKAFWKTTVPATGLYEVSVHFFHTDNRTTDADYFITDGNGRIHHFIINQRDNPTGWYVFNYLFEWKKGQEAVVILDGTDDNQSDEADAVRWVLKNEKKTSIYPPLKLLLDD